MTTSRHTEHPCAACTPVQAATVTHLEGLPAVCVGARAAPVQDARQHHALHVGSRQGQQVVQALVPGLEGPQARGVLAQALGHSPQQPRSAVPAVGGRQSFRQLIQVWPASIAWCVCTRAGLRPTAAPFCISCSTRQPHTF